jgi:hypothetical protein
VGHNTTVSFRRRDDVTVTLSVTSSYLRSEEEGSETPAGVIVVFSDITEVVTLQNAEKELNRQLRDAYRDLEVSNKTLSAALRKVQVIRIVVTLCVVVLFVGIGLYSWNGDMLKKQSLPFMMISPLVEGRSGRRTPQWSPSPFLKHIAGRHIEPLSEN